MNIGKLLAKQSDRLDIFVYLLGRFGVPKTDVEIDFFIENFGVLLINGTFTNSYISTKLLECLNNKQIKDAGGKQFISEIQKLNPKDTDEIKQFILSYHTESQLNNSGITSNTKDSQKQLETSETNQENTQEKNKEAEEIINNQGDNMDTNIKNLDTLNLVIELFNRLHDTYKLKELNINLSDETIQSLSDSLGKTLSTKHSKQEKHVWSTSAKELPAPKLICGANMDEIEATLNIKKALIIEGVPGTGKSQLMFNLINKLSNENAKHFKVISFNQSTSYSEFIEGLRQVDGEWVYVDGTFLSFCKIADADREHNYYFGIDEISRGDTESIFGELMSAIECRDTIITLQSGNTLVVPSNLYIIGTMNTLDRSSKFIDRATADRFSHIRLEPQWNTVYMESLDIDKELNAEEIGKLKSLFETLSYTMNSVNNIIKRDSLNGYDNVIGTRSVSIPRLNINKLRNAIKYSIIPEIKSKQTMCSINTSNNLDSCIEDLKNI